MSLNPQQYPSPALTPETTTNNLNHTHAQPPHYLSNGVTNSVKPEDNDPNHDDPNHDDQCYIRSEVEQVLLKLSQDLYEMEICAGDVGQGMEGAVPNYMAKINQSFFDLSSLSSRMTETIPKNVIERVDQYQNPHQYTKMSLTRATGENQYALGRMLGLESFRKQLYDSISSEFPDVQLPERRHHPITSLRENGSNGQEEFKQESQHPQQNRT